MNEYLSLICRSPLFEGIREDEAQAMLGCVGAHTGRFDKGASIIRPGDKVTEIGMVLQGAIRIERIDYWGNRTIIGSSKPGQLFGEAYACAADRTADVSAVAAQDCTVLFIDARRITASCTSACSFHTRLARNLMSSLARRAISLTRKIDHLSKRTTRAKLLAYLSDQAEQAGSNEFSIPFNRQELADYLSVDRSAMSAELSKMKRDGLLSYHLNRFRLLDDQLV